MTYKKTQVYLGFFIIINSKKMNLTKKVYELYLENNQRICIDSRSKKIKNSIFFAIKGERFNGNDFIKDALRNGAKLIITDEKTQENKSIILVEDSLQTLQNIAEMHRSKFNIPIIAITGSYGKTTTKDILHHLIKSTYNTCSTKGNLNNHIGVPLTILSLKKKHTAAIIEMGANHIGEIKQLCKIAQPTHGIITNIGSAHIGEFGGIKNIKKAKNELFDHLKKTDGVIIYNEEDPILQSLVNNYKKISTYKIPTYHKETTLKTKLEKYTCTPFISIYSPNNNRKITTKILGKHNINNLVSAIKIAELLKVDNEKIVDCLKQFQLKNNRSEFICTKHNEVILDAYNANPNSMSSGIINFLEIHRFLKNKQQLFILGDMLELGENEVDYHQDIINLLKKKNVKDCILIGDIFEKTKTCKSYTKVKSTERCKEILRKKNIKNTSIFIKGSRKLTLESCIDFL